MAEHSRLDPHRTVDRPLTPDSPSTVDGTGAYQPADSTEPAAAGQPGGWPHIPGYAVTAEIAKGGMGRVFAARDLTLDREVAIKTLLPGANAGRFVTESKITAKLPHPGIPPVHALGTLPDGSPFLAMKLIHGRTLSELLKARPTPTHDLPRFVQVFEQIAQAVGFAHSRGVIHRDLKPLNVMAGEFGEVQVMDWGLARESASGGRQPPGSETHQGTDAPRSPDLTQAGSIMGTPGYMAPEQARGEAVDARADVFALGAVLAAVLTGKPAFVGTTVNETIRKAANAELGDALGRLDGCGADAELVGLAKRCLAADADARPADGRAVAAEVGAYRAGVEARLRQAETERAEAVVREGEQRKRRRVVQWAGGAIAGVLLAGVVGTGAALVRAEIQRDKAMAAEKLAGERLTQVSAEQAKTEEQRKIAVANEKVAEAETRVALAVQTFLREKLLLQADSRTQANALRLAGRPAAKATPNPTIRELLDRAATVLTPEVLDRHLQSDPAVIATVLSTVGESYAAIGVYDRAIDLLDRALALRRKHLAPDHRNTFASAINLAQALEYAGKLELARDLLEDTRGKALAARGPEDHAAVLATNNLAGVYLSLAKPEKAVELLEQNRERMKRFSDRNGLGYPIFLNNLGVAYAMTKRLDHAKPLLEEGLKRCDDELGADHPETFQTLGNLAYVYSELGDHARAAPLHERVLRQSETINGPDHPDTLRDLNNLASLYWRLNRLDKSVPLFEQAVKRMRAKFPADNPQLLNTMANLGVNYRDIGRVEDALPLLEEAHGKRGRHAMLAWVGTALADVYIRAGRTTEAVKLVRAELTEARSFFPPNSPQLASQLALSGSHLLDLREYADAETTLRECLDLREKLLAKKQAQPWQVANVRVMLGAALVTQKKYTDAEPLLTAGYSGLKADEKVLPKASVPNLGNAARALAALYTATGQPAKAAEWQAKVPREALPRPRPAPEK